MTNVLGVSVGFTAGSPPPTLGFDAENDRKKWISFPPFTDEENKVEKVQVIFQKSHGDRDGL